MSFIWPGFSPQDAEQHRAPVLAMDAWGRLADQRWQTEGMMQKNTLALQPHAVPFTTQTRLTFDVVLPLWGHRGPRPTPAVPMHHGPPGANTGKFTVSSNECVINTLER